MDAIMNNVMNKDPNYYLEKARIFYEKAALDDTIDQSNDPIEQLILEEEIDLIEDIYDDENPIEIEPGIVAIPDDQHEQNQLEINVKIQPGYSRYYDPITKHYYSTAKVLGNEDPLDPIIKLVKKSGVWYPENKLSYDTIYDPDSNRYYKINKIYNDDGTFTYTYNKIQNKMVKQPGTNYYRPISVIKKTNQ